MNVHPPSSPPHPPDPPHQTLHSDDIGIINSHEVTDNSVHKLNIDLNRLTLKKTETKN